MLRALPSLSVHKPMSSPAVALRPRRAVPLLAPAEARQRSIRRKVGTIWGLLVLNALTYYGSLLHMPSAGGKVITQGALPLAPLMALTVNRRVVGSMYLLELSLAASLILLSAAGQEPEIEASSASGTTASHRAGRAFRTAGLCA